MIGEVAGDGTVRRWVLGVAAVSPCQPYERSRGGHSVPGVAERGGQVALSPMRRWVAVALGPEAVATGHGAPAVVSSARHVHLPSRRLADADVAQAASDAAVLALQTVGCRVARSADATPRARLAPGAPVPRSD